VKKSIWLFFTSFRRKPESSVFKALAIDWTPVFTGVTSEIQFFHTFGGRKGGGMRLQIFMQRLGKDLMKKICFDGKKFS
jgi:hypothetical protein